MIFTVHLMHMVFLESSGKQQQWNKGDRRILHDRYQSSFKLIQPSLNKTIINLWDVTYALKWFRPRPYPRQGVWMIFHSCTMIHVNIKWIKTEFSTYNLSIAFSKAIITQRYPLQCCMVVIFKKTFVNYCRSCRKQSKKLFLY